VALRAQPDGIPGCGICRVGGSDNFFHCGTCGTCLAASMREGHACRASLLGANCPICFELLQVRPFCKLNLVESASTDCDVRRQAAPLPCS